MPYIKRVYLSITFIAWGGNTLSNNTHSKSSYFLRTNSKQVPWRHCNLPETESKIYVYYNIKHYYQL